MKFKLLVAAAFIATLATGEICAQQSDSMIKTRKDAELLVPRPFRESVPSMIKSDKDILDSIETSSPGVKILLFADNTWKYWKDPSVILKNDVFSDNWNTETAVPYRVEQKDLPEKISLWIVDTLSDYRCPNPVKVYSPFGYRHRRRHQGVDLPLKTGDPVYAAFSGKVRLSKYYSGYGNLVIIRHENGLETFYAHLSKREVESGEWVEAGQEIGLGGSTGRSSGAHLHFETRYMGYAFDPEWLIDFETGTLRHRLFTLKRQYLDANSRYVPESDDEEIDIHDGDQKDYATQDSIAAAKKAAEEKAAAERAAAQYHKVRSGDTLSGIAHRYGTTVSKIIKLNPGLTTRTTLKIGRNIRVK